MGWAVWRHYRAPFKLPGQHGKTTLPKGLLVIVLDTNKRTAMTQAG